MHAVDDISNLVDLDRYPVHDLPSPAGVALVAEIQARLAADSAASLSGFLHGWAVAALAEEAEALAPLASPGATRALIPSPPTSPGRLLRTITPPGIGACVTWRMWRMT